MSNPPRKVRFLPHAIVTEVTPGTTLLAAAHAVNLPLRSDCGSAGTCGKCTVHVAGYVVDGTEPFDWATAKKVLACQEKVADKNLTVYVPEESLASSSVQVVTESLNSVQTHDFSFGRLKIVPVELTPPSREDHRPDLVRLKEVLPGFCEFSQEQLASLPVKLRQSGWKGAAVFLDDHFLDFVGSDETQGPFYAVALDLGTTTLAAQLVRLDAGPEWESPCRVRINPQNVFGDDIISRIQKMIDDPANSNRLQQTILNAVREIIQELIGKENISPKKILLLAVSGNTVMEQIFLGIDSRPLGFSPFVPASNRFPTVLAKELALNIHPFGRVETLPILGGFVGGDLVAGILATNLDRLAEEDSPAILIDIGTNGEIILSHKNRLYAAATAAGPAFEGARIQFGMIAAEGAIDHVDWEEADESLAVHTIGDAPPKGICGSGLIDITAELLKRGVLNSRGVFAAADSLPVKLRERITTFEGKPAFRLSEKIVLTQKDVRQIQLAAGAIRCGILLLLELAGLKPSEIRSLFLAGGFGNFIRPENARRIGLFPPEITADRIRFCGNTSLLGAKMFVRDRCISTRIGSILEQAEHVDLSTRPNFSAIFGESMIFPE
ncbi:MAG: ASKHA domain-containing protein [Planctomycetaceae bacterium]|nr:ASKHA domain-containing protein [Planctomycetaceae bacterium]